MAFLLTPGVNISEYSITTIVPGVDTTEGAYVGFFDWGPINDIQSASNELELVAQVLTPDINTYPHFFTCSNFLAYTNKLKYVRADAAGLVNASANNSGLKILNRDDYQQNYTNGANTYGAFAAKWKGAAGNSLKVSLWASPDTLSFGFWNYNGYFTGPPDTSSYVANLGGRNDEMHVAIIDVNGRFSGVANTVLEKFAFVSKASDAKNQDGTSNYYVNVINDRSNYIWWLSHPADGPGWANSANWGSAALNTNFGIGDNVAYTRAFANGAYATPTSGNTEIAYDLFNNPDVVDASLMMTGSHPTAVGNYVISNIAEVRKDLVVFVSPQQSSVVFNHLNEVDDVITDRQAYGSSSYAIMDMNYKYQYDKYNDVNRWVPLNGDIAGITARSDFTRDPWVSPAGFNRGQIKNVVKLAWQPSPSDQADLYSSGINNVMTFKNQGPILFGDKTLLTKPDAFDRINVRRLFIVLEKAISTSAKYSLFEINDAFTRAQFVSMVEPFLRDVKGRRGIYNFKVVCDETNNTGQVIDSNRFIGDIYIKPARSINWIQLNFVAVGTDVDFNIVVGKFG